MRARAHRWCWAPHWSLIVALGLGQAALQAAQGQAVVRRRVFEVDPLWPKPLPNHWILGSVIGVGVDSTDHVFIIHRGYATLTSRTEAGLNTKPPIGECCAAAPPILEFDPEGNLVKAWGGPARGLRLAGLQSRHHDRRQGQRLDRRQRTCTTPGHRRRCERASTRTSSSSRTTGKLLQQIGRPAPGVEQQRACTHFGRVAKISFDPQANEAYVADGYGNKRVAVLDMNTGTIKRFWGAYGNAPSDTNLRPLQSRRAADPAVPQSGALRRADQRRPGVRVRPAERPHPGVPEGRQVREGSAHRAQDARRRLGVGHRLLAGRRRRSTSTWPTARTSKIYVMDRQSLEILTSFGDGGRQPGQFFAVHSIATDSKGNIYTTETYEGKRLQKFAYKGVRRITARNQGVVWPKP